MSVPEPVRNLSPSNKAAIAAVRARAVREREVHRTRAERVLRGAGIKADVGRLCMSVQDRARVVLNFHPDRLLADGRTVAEALRDEGAYRSQFETGISNGGLTAYPGGDRDEWERRLFGGSYHARAIPGSVRPKYGGLNLAGFTNGPAPAFGSCALVLAPHMTARTTFLFGDSSERYEEMGTADAFEPVLAALLERVAATGQMLGLSRISVGEMIEHLSSGALRPRAFSRVLDDYIETHTTARSTLSQMPTPSCSTPAFATAPSARRCFKPQTATSLRCGGMQDQS